MALRELLDSGCTSRALLEARAAVDARTRYQLTALMEACTMGKEDVARCLCEHGAAVRARAQHAGDDEEREQRLGHPRERRPRIVLLRRDARGAQPSRQLTKQRLDRKHS